MTLIAIVHLLLCIFLIVLVLIQDFKGGAMGVFGGGGSQSVFGASGGGNFLITLTKWVSLTLLATVLGISFISQSGKSVFEKEDQTVKTQDVKNQNVQKPSSDKSLDKNSKSEPFSP